MSDTPPRMEVCPYCKKSFKRLKSHLPYCKKIGTTIPAEPEGCQAKPAVLSHANKRKGPAKEVIKAEEANLKRESKERNTKLIRKKPEGTIKPLPLLGLEKASNKNTDKYIKNQIQFSPKILKNTGPKITFQGETKAQLYASENTSPERELASNLPKSGDRSNPAKTFSPNQERGYCPGLPRNVQTPSAHLKLDSRDLPREELVVKALDVPTDYPSLPVRLNDGVKTVRTSLSSSESRDHLSEFPTDVRNSETQEKNLDSLILGLRVNPLGKIRVEESKVIMFDMKEKELHFGVEVCGSKGNAEKSLSVSTMPAWTSRSDGSKNPSTDDSATEKKCQDEGPYLNLSTLQGTPRNEFLSALQSSHESLSSLAIKFLQEEKEGRVQHQVTGIQTLMEGKGQTSLEPRASHQCHALHTRHQKPVNLTWHHTPKTPFTNHVDAADKRALPSSMGLEWFPELYPGYLGLGVLPGKPQYWNAMAQKPRFISPKGERLSQVLWLERSTTDRRIWEHPTSLATSSFSLLRLLGALQKGWSRCSTITRRGLGGVTVLFTGYFVLCCKWSFGHLSKAFCIFSPIIGISEGFSGWLCVYPNASIRTLPTRPPCHMFLLTSPPLPPRQP
ncbi:uncharacterized protein C17orf80 homolog [Orycteropus afer afer]|uniref:Uncharacterized protein C17orf80 homolog n=1 Tax=Orycteropus afer afer TaxID=1230840 RepID=A0AC54ZGG8_ORYAF|nr:uncharacterized protein C17orf80 homolog [Orycteropus afer afer]